MRVIFRCDASASIGAGHVMRCLTLAGALRTLGAEASFICREEAGHLGELITARGFELFLLPPALEWDFDSKASATHIMERKLDVDWLVVDHYGLDARWHTALRGSASRLMVIDDTADRPHDCDLLLDQNYYRDPGSRYLGKVHPRVRQLLGPSFALLRPEFATHRRQDPIRSGIVERILVFLGGMDAVNCTQRAIEGLETAAANHVDVEVVIGAQNPHRQAIARECARRGHTLRIQAENMAELMNRADLAIGAGGSATWERCCLGLPTITLSVAQNQVAIAEELAALGGCVYLGDHESVDPAAIGRAVAGLIASPFELRAMSAIAAGLVDGLGAARVAQILKDWK